MLYLQGTRTVSLEPASFTNGATASLVIDRCPFPGGPYDDLKIVATFARTNAATNVPSVLKLQESDVTNATSFVDIAGSSQTSAVTSMSTTAGNVVEWDLANNGARKRYIQVVASPVTTQVIAIQADLGRPHIFPFTNTDKNVLNCITL